MEKFLHSEPFSFLRFGKVVWQNGHGTGAGEKPPVAPDESPDAGAEKDAQEATDRLKAEIHTAKNELNAHIDQWKIDPNPTIQNIAKDAEASASEINISDATLRPEEAGVFILRFQNILDQSKEAVDRAKYDELLDKARVALSDRSREINLTFADEINNVKPLSPQAEDMAKKQLASSMDALFAPLDDQLGGFFAAQGGEKFSEVTQFIENLKPKGKVTTLDFPKIHEEFRVNLEAIATADKLPHFDRAQAINFIISETENDIREITNLEVESYPGEKKFKINGLQQLEADIIAMIAEANPVNDKTYIPMTLAHFVEEKDIIFNHAELKTEEWPHGRVSKVVMALGHITLDPYAVPFQGHLPTEIRPEEGSGVKIKVPSTITLRDAYGMAINALPAGVEVTIGNAIVDGKTENGKDIRYIMVTLKNGFSGYILLDTSIKQAIQKGINKNPPPPRSEVRVRSVETRPSSDEDHYNVPPYLFQDRGA